MSNNTNTLVGTLDKKVIDILSLSMEEGQPIFCGESNKEHMKSEHPDDFEKYSDRIEEIIERPDFIALHPTKKSIEYIKLYFDHNEEIVLLAVRASAKGTLFARSLYSIDKNKFDSYAKSGTMKPYK